MDVDFFMSCSPETQMELLDMAMQLDNPHEFQLPMEIPPASFNMTDPTMQELYYNQSQMAAAAREAAIREMIFRVAAMQPVHIDPESVKPPKRRNVRISTDPQSVAARHRRERISERIRILQRLVPGGTKMDTASMLDEAIHYVKFLKTQVQSLERAAARPEFSVVPSNAAARPEFSVVPSNAAGGVATEGRYGSCQGFFNPAAPNHPHMLI